MASVPNSWGDPTIVPNLVAEHIVNTSSGLTIDKQYLASAISEITVRTQVLGSALLQVTVNDPRWVIQRSGLCDKDSDGKLKQKADVNFPEGTDVWWRLVMVQGLGDPSQPNLTLIFQHRVITYLMNCWSPLGWPHGKAGSTRAQFIKYLMDKMPSELPKDVRGPGSNTLNFICPEINEVQPIASANVFGSEVVTAQSAAAQNAGINKLPGLTAATKVTVKGQRPTALQIQTINTILGQGQALGAPTVALVASMYAAMGESSIDPNAGGGGVFQGTSFPTPSDVAGEARAFFQGGSGFGNGFSPPMGAIAAAKKGLPDWQIANGVEDNAVWGGPTGPHGDSYGHQWPGGQAEGLGEARAIVNAFNGGLSGVTAQPQSDVAQLTRGTPDNPDEDTWTCAQRLASEVNWMLFTSPQPAPGHWGNYIYYMDGVTAVAQRPSLYIDLSDDGTLWSLTDPDTGKVITGNSDGMLVNPPQYTLDNTAFQFAQTKASAAAAGKTGGKKVQRKTRIQTPQTPSQVMCNMIAGVMEFNAGDVFVFHNTGPLDSRWIVEDVTHNTLADLYAQFTLGPPTYAYPEPQSTLLPSPTVPALTGATGGASGVADIAKQALARQQSQHCFHYQQIRPVEYNILTQGTVYIDCSGFAIACYKLAGLDDPSHNNYDGAGFTGDMITHCTQVQRGNAQPGDLCFFGPSTTSTVHVNVYVGNGQSISMGQEGDPSSGPAEQMGPAGFLGYFRPDVANTSQGVIGQGLTGIGTIVNPNPVQSGVNTVVQGVVTTIGGIFGSVFARGSGAPPGPGSRG